MTGVPLSRCTACGEPRITVGHRGRRLIRAHSTDREDVYSPERGENCPGSWQPVVEGERERP